MKKRVELNIKFLLIGFICMSVLVFVGVTVNHKRLESWTPDMSIVGTWTGTGETRQFGELEKIKVKIRIDKSGAVKGTVGEAALEECVIKLNRNDFERFINVKNDYSIGEGHLEGAVTSEDKLTYRNIMMPFNIEEDTIVGTLFRVEGLMYPEPLLLHLELKKQKNISLLDEVYLLAKGIYKGWLNFNCRIYQQGI